MEDKQTTTVVMTETEHLQYEAFKEARARELAEAKAKQMRSDYAKMVDDEIESAIPQLMAISGDIKAVKAQVFDNFKAIIDLKGEMFRTKNGSEMGYKSHTFTNTSGTMRVTLGQYLNDNYLDTADDGVEKIREYIQSLATDEKSQALVGMGMKLLAKDAKGTLKAQRILQLRKIADESGSPEFIEGVRIIEEAYRPVPTRTFVRAEIRDDKTGAWKSIPLGMTES